MRDDPFSSPGPETIVVGTGRLTLDIIVRAGEPPAMARSQAGGSCGNVLTNLAWLGWQAYPVANLGEDDPGHRYTRDLARFGVHLDLIQHISDQHTPIIVHHIESSPSGVRHSFSTSCPFCGEPFPPFEPIPLADVENRLPSVPRARVFYFDRDSPGALLLARRGREQGALVVFEPNYAGRETQFDEALSVAHVLKFSRERLAGLPDCHPLSGPDLVIETLGADGLRYRDQRHSSGDWQHLPALHVAIVRDAVGSGDWCTAGLLHFLAQNGARGLTEACADDLRMALQFGQALAAWNCAFEGARGGVYTRAAKRCQEDVRRLLADACFDPAPAETSTLDQAGRFCPCSDCPPAESDRPQTVGARKPGTNEPRTK